MTNFYLAACLTAAFVVQQNHADRASSQQEVRAALTTEEEEEEEAYNQFRLEHRRHAHSGDSVHYADRLALWREMRLKVDEHNARHDRSWTAVVNKFADYTPEEFRALLGHRPLPGRERETRPRASSFLQVASGPQEQPVAVAKSKDWSTSLRSASKVLDQGACGSCWAVAAVGALEMHFEIETRESIKGELSWDQVKDCSNNTRKCGGKGGCQGSTAELAYQYLSGTGGLAIHDVYRGNKNRDQQCKRTTPHVSISGYQKLPANKLQPLMEAVSTLGPVVVSVDASLWNSYGSGVFDSCPRNAIVNHAVVLVGYGTDASANKDYWLIRNSWSKGWGEKGFIRVFRHGNDIDNYDAGYCGKDDKPQEGVACEGENEPIDVCGMCGILYDSCYPTGVQSAKDTTNQVVNWNPAYKPTIADVTNVHE